MARSKSKLESDGARHIRQLEEAKYAALSQQAALEARLAELIALGGDNQEEINRVIQAKWQAASDAARLGLEISESQQAKNYSLFLGHLDTSLEDKEKRDIARHKEQKALLEANNAEVKKLGARIDTVESRQAKFTDALRNIEETQNEVVGVVQETRGDVDTLKQDMVQVKERLTNVESDVAEIKRLIQSGREEDAESIAFIRRQMKQDAE